MTRTATVLSRFPAHLRADRPGTVLDETVGGLVTALDVQTSQVGRIRASHRLDSLDEEADLLLLAGLHGLGPETFELVRGRLAGAADLAVLLGDPAAPAEAVDAALATLPELFGVQASAFDDPAQLAGALHRLVAYAAVLATVRGCMTRLVRVHRDGNGTVSALLRAAAAFLALEVVEITHLDDRSWHVARCLDLLRLTRDGDAGSATVEPDEDLLALEENPFRLQVVDPVPRRPGEVFRQLRGGFDEVQVSVRVRGIEDRTVAPQVVNTGAGKGVAYTGTVPDGQELRFESDGRITLAGANVTRRGYSFSGGVFASEDPRRGDFVFGSTDDDQPAPADRVATFVVTRPLTDAFDPGAVFPHAGGLVEALPMRVGESTWVLFVGEAAFGSAPSGFAIPADRSAFAGGDGADPAGRASVFADEAGAPLPAAAEVGFDWQEREPYAVRLWLPQRLLGLDAAEGAAPAQPVLRDRLRRLLDRHRAGGVHVYVEHADDRWTLGEGVVREPGSTEPVGGLVLGTRLWPAVAQPDPTPIP